MTTRLELQAHATAQRQVDALEALTAVLGRVVELLERVVAHLETETP